MTKVVYIEKIMNKVVGIILIAYLIGAALGYKDFVINTQTTLLWIIAILLINKKVFNKIKQILKIIEKHASNMRVLEITHNHGINICCAK